MRKETQELIDTLAARSALRGRSHVSLNKKLPEALDEMNAEAQRILRTVQQAKLVETDESVRSLYSEVRNANQVVHDFTSQVDVAWQKLMDALQQLAEVERRLHGSAKAAGYTVPEA